MDVRSLVAFKSHFTHEDFEELVKKSFEKLLYLESDEFLINYIRELQNTQELHDHRPIDFSIEWDRLKSLSDHVSTEYRWLVSDLSFDSLFFNSYVIDEVEIDFVKETLVIAFAEVESVE